MTVRRSGNAVLRRDEHRRNRRRTNGPDRRDWGLFLRMRSRTGARARTTEAPAARTTTRQAVVADVMHGVIAQPRRSGRSQATVARPRFDAAIDGIPRNDRIGCSVPAHQPQVNVIRGQTKQPHANRRETETHAIAIGHFRTAHPKRAVRGVETIALAPAHVVVQLRTREMRRISKSISS